MLCFGNIDYYYVFKIFSLYAIASNFNIFKTYMKFLNLEKSCFDKLFLDLAIEKQFSREVNFITISLLFKRDVIVYADHDNISFLKTIYRVNKTENKAFLVCLNRKHFVPILSCNQNFNEPLISRASIFPEPDFIGFK